MAQTAKKPTPNPDYPKLVKPENIIPTPENQNAHLLSWMNMHQKNMKMVVAIGQVAVQNFQSFATRQADLMKHNMEESKSLVGAILTAPSMQDKVICHAEASKYAVEKYMANMREATESFTSFNNLVMEAISARMGENLEEVRSHMKTDEAD